MCSWLFDTTLITTCCYYFVGSCLRCGKCCTSFGVCLTSFDLIRIIDHTGLDPKDFVQFMPEQPDRERTELAILIDGEFFLMVLKWNKKFDCCFYGKSGCNIYPARPMLCRTYPFCLKSGKLTDTKSRSCSDNWVPEDIDLMRYCTDMTQYRKEVNRYNQLVKAWNKSGGGTLENFLNYIGKNGNSRKSL